MVAEPYTLWGRHGNGAAPSATARRLCAGHGTEVGIDLRLAEQITIESDLADRAGKPGIGRHSANIQGRAAGGGRDAILAHAAGLQVI